MLGLSLADGETDGLVLEDGDTDGLSEEDGDTEAEGETDGLTEEDGLTLADGETLGLSLEDGDAEEDGDIDGDSLDDGLTLAEGEVDGDTEEEPAAAICIAPYISCHEHAPPVVFVVILYDPAGVLAPFESPHEPLFPVCRIVHPVPALFVAAPSVIANWNSQALSGVEETVAVLSVTALAVPVASCETGVVWFTPV
jgi:hypothetical protein